MSFSSTVAALLGWRKAVVHSPLSVAECSRRLKAAADSDWTLFGGKPVVGTVGPVSGGLRKRLGAFSRNSFQTILSFRLIDAGEGTNLRCTSGMSPFVIAFMALWFGGVGSTLFIFIAHQPTDLSGNISQFVMIGFGVVLVLVCRFFARNEHDFLVNFVSKTVEGELLAGHPK